MRRAAPILRDLSLASTDGFAAMQEIIGDVGYVQTGLLMAYHTEKGRAENLKAAALAEDAGLAVERLGAEAARTLEPALLPPCDGAVLYRQDGRVDPEALLHRLATYLRNQGVAIQEGVTAAGFETQGDRVQSVHTATGPIHADEVVLAAGAWTGRLASALGLRVPVQPARGYSVTVPAPDGGPRLPTILTDEKLTITPMPGRLRFAGTLALAGFDATVDARRAAPIQALAERYAPDAAEHAPVWSGFRPCSPDGLPIIGRSPRHRNLTLATGHGMMGITLAPITGDLVAHLVSGTTPPLDVRPLAPDRF